MKSLKTKIGHRAVAIRPMQMFEAVEFVARLAKFLREHIDELATFNRLLIQQKRREAEYVIGKIASLFLDDENVRKELFVCLSLLYGQDVSAWPASDVIRLLPKVLKLNDFQKSWQTAYMLGIVSQSDLGRWIWARLQESQNVSVGNKSTH